jgi:hypothetical protein
MSVNQPPNPPFFPNIYFNPDFYNTGSTNITLDYANTHYLSRTGVANSIASSTTFNGLLICNNGLTINSGVLTSINITNSSTVTTYELDSTKIVNTGNLSTGSLSTSGNIICNELDSNKIVNSTSLQTNTLKVVSTSQFLADLDLYTTSNINNCNNIFVNTNLFCNNLKAFSGTTVNILPDTINEVYFYSNGVDSLFENIATKGAANNYVGHIEYHGDTFNNLNNIYVSSSYTFKTYAKQTSILSGEPGTQNTQLVITDASGVNVSKLTSSGIITSNGISNTGTISSSGLISSNGISNTGTISSSGLISSNGISNTGTISSSGLISSNGISNTGTISSSGLISSNGISNTGTISSSGLISSNGISNTGTISSSGLISSNGISNTGTISSTGIITSNGISNTGTISSTTLSLSSNLACNNFGPYSGSKINFLYTNANSSYLTTINDNFYGNYISTNNLFSHNPNYLMSVLSSGGTEVYNAQANYYSYNHSFYTYPSGNSVSNNPDVNSTMRLKIENTGVSITSNTNLAIPPAYTYTSIPTLTNSNIGYTNNVVFSRWSLASSGSSYGVDYSLLNIFTVSDFPIGIYQVNIKLILSASVTALTTSLYYSLTSSSSPNYKTNPSSLLDRSATNFNIPVSTSSPYYCSFEISGIVNITWSSTSINNYLSFTTASGNPLLVNGTSTAYNTNAPYSTVSFTRIA